MARKKSISINRGTDDKGNHRISTVAQGAYSEDYEIEFYHGTYWEGGGDKIVEHITVDNGLRWEDSNVISFDSFEQAQAFHKALGAVLAEAKLWRASHDIE